VPSIYFIDSSTGVDLEVTGGEVTKEKLLESIEKATTKMQVLKLEFAKSYYRSFYPVVKFFSY
jgi:hypothetical protein